MTVVVPFLLLAPLLLVPLGLRLLDQVAPGASPRSRLQVAVVPAATLLAAAFALPPGGPAAALSMPWLIVAGLVALGAAWRLLHDQDRFRPGRVMPPTPPRPFSRWGPPSRRPTASASDRSTSRRRSSC